MKIKKAVTIYTLILCILYFFSFTIIYAQTNNFLFKPFNSNFYIYQSGGKKFILHQNRLTRWKLDKNFRNLSSAKRINNAADDPAGFAVAEKMNAIIKGLKQESFNMEDYKNYLKTVEGVVAQDYNIIKRIRELVLKSSNFILGPDDREIIQREISELLKQIDMNARFSQFNTKSIIPQLTVKNLGLDRVDVVRNLYGSMKSVDNALEKLIRKRIAAGIKDNVLTLKIKGKYHYLVNIMQSESRISDLDMAEEMVNFQKNNIMLKTQYGVIMMSK